MIRVWNVTVMVRVSTFLGLRPSVRVITVSVKHRPSKHYTSGPIPVSYWLIKTIEATVLAFTCQYGMYL